MLRLSALLILLCIVSTSCVPSFINKRYAYVDREREWELELRFNSDSTFYLKDQYGCVQMGQKGTWKTMVISSERRSLVLTDTTHVYESMNLFENKRFRYVSNLTNKEYIFTENQYFPLVLADTVVFADTDEILFRGLRFKRTRGNLQRQRIRMIEIFYVDKFGRKNFIEVFGEGRSIKIARKNLVKCSN